MEVREETLRLEEEVKRAFKELGISKDQRELLTDRVSILKKDHLYDYKHSLRCSLLGKDAALYARTMHPNILFYAGLLHDVGLVMEKKDHQIHTYHIIRDRFSFSSLVALNHRIGEKPYLHDGRGFKKETIRFSEYCALVFRVIDHFDELIHPRHEENSEPIVVPGIQIKKELINRNGAQEYFINNLYKDGIFK